MLATILYTHAASSKTTPDDHQQMQSLQQSPSQHVANDAAQNPPPNRTDSKETPPLMNPDQHTSTSTTTTPSFNNGELLKTFNHFLWAAARNGPEALAANLEKNPTLRLSLQSCAQHLQWSTRDLMKNHGDAASMFSGAAANATAAEFAAQHEFIEWLKARLQLDFSPSVSNNNFAAAIVELVDPQARIQEADVDQSLPQSSLDDDSNKMRFSSVGASASASASASAMEENNKTPNNNWWDESDPEKFYDELRNNGQKELWDESDPATGKLKEMFKERVGQNVAARVNAVKKYKRALMLNDALDQQKNIALSAINDLSIATDLRINDFSEKPWLDTPLCTGHNVFTGARASKICVFNVPAVATDTAGK